MVFAAVLGFIFLLGLAGVKPSLKAYALVGLAALAASVWEYLA